MKDKQVSRTIEEYEDIIHLPHPESKKHPRMSAADRAAQFAPFAAVTGHDAAIKETARLTDKRIELDESELDMIRQKLSKVQLKITGQAGQPFVSVTFFQPDERKEGGRYLTKQGEVKRIDEYSRKMIFTDGEEIFLDQIVKMEES